MTITYSITQKRVIGHRREHLGSFTLSSAEVTAYITTGLRVVEDLYGWSQQSGGLAIITYPTSFPNDNSTSGHFTIVFTSTAGPVYWKAMGKY